MIKSSAVLFVFSLNNIVYEEKNDLLKDIGKSLGNNLFGKFGQRSVLTELDDPKNYTKEQLENMKMIGNAVLVEKDD
ncbi:MAG TPA: hypothetical protein PKW50_10110, partial [Syntrophomonas sp.]|nr:hypothetical protein [Syntrophomonas sp.]